MRCEEIDATALQVELRPRTTSLVCTGCGCTDEKACPGGCCWVSMDPPLCSACEDEANTLLDQEWVGSPGPLKIEHCPASSTPAPHAPIFLDDSSGYCARCKQGFVL